MRTAAAVLVCLACTLSAGERLDPSVLPADTRWALHADVTGLLASGLGGLIRDRLGEEDPASKLAALEAITGFHPLRDLRAVTVAGPDFGEERGVLYVRGTFDAERLVTLVRASDGYRNADYGEVAIHSWPEHPGGARLFATFAEADLLLISKHEDLVRDAVDALAGRAAGAEGLDAITGREDHFFCVAAANGLAAAEGVHPRAAFLKRVRDVAGFVGERDGRLELRVHLATRNEEDAGRVVDILDGLRAVAEISVEDRPLLADVLAGLAIEREGTAVDVSLPVALETLRRLAADHLGD